MERSSHVRRAENGDAYVTLNELKKMGFKVTNTVYVQRLSSFSGTAGEPKPLHFRLPVIKGSE